MLPPEKHVQPLRLHEALGGLVHPGIDLAEGAYVLDVGREVGDWTGELAQCYPQHHIVRVQTSATAVQGVAGTGRKQWANVTYASVQDVLQLEDTFAPESFDLICVHFCASEVPLQQFPALMQSLLRLCKEQGHVVWLETDLPVTCDDACDRLAWLLIAALRARGAMVACLSVPQVGLAAWMEQWLRDAGCNIVQDSFYRAFVSAGNHCMACLCSRCTISHRTCTPSCCICKWRERRCWMNCSPKHDRRCSTRTFSRSVPSAGLSV